MTPQTRGGRGGSCYPTNTGWSRGLPYTRSGCTCPMFSVVTWWSVSWCVSGELSGMPSPTSRYAPLTPPGDVRPLRPQQLWPNHMSLTPNFLISNMACLTYYLDGSRRLIAVCPCRVPVPCPRAVSGGLVLRVAGTYMLRARI